MFPSLAKLTKGTGLLVLLLVIGGIFGTLIGYYFGDTVSFLGFGSSIGVNPTTIDLLVIKLTLGFILEINIATIIGFFIALFIYYRL